MSIIKRRVFVSFVNPELLDERRLAIQKEIIRKIEELNLQPEMFFISGTSAAMAWSLPNAIDIMKKCVGAIVIAFPRWDVKDSDGNGIQMAMDIITSSSGDERRNTITLSF